MKRPVAPLMTLILLALAPAMAAPVSAGPPSNQDQLRELIGEVMAFRRLESPLPVPEGTDPRYSDRFEDVSVDRFEQEREAIEGFRTQLAAIDIDALPPSDAIDARILGLQLRDRAAELGLRGYLLPLGSRSGFHFGFASAPLSWSFEDIEDYDRYIARMQSFLAYTRAQIGLMRAGIEAGWVMPAVIMDGYERTAGEHAVERAPDSAFAAPLAEIPDTIPALDRERIRADGMAAIEDSVLPAYRELERFFVEEYIPAARPGIAISDLPGGAEFYDHRVRRYTTLDLTAQQVHEIGLREVARMRAEMDGIRAEVGFEGDHLDFVEFLRTDPRFTVHTEDEYLALVSLAAKQMEGNLPRLFRRLPVTPYGVRAMPPHIAPRQSAGYYDRGDADGTRAGWVNINTSMLHTRPTWVARPLAFHEGSPGHHLQIMLALENPEISEFRRGGGVTVFVEGWGLYAERLGLEVGLYDDPYDRFGMWSYQIWRACRLVVDTGMHALGWDRQRAIDFMAENTGMAPEAVAAEIDRHITEPGQGLAYTMGELVISRLRVEAEEKLGERFDLREYHDVVLRNGAIPLSILEEQVRGWIDATAARTDR
jgi:uncharacterized protein (DUF885 family)